MTSTVTIAPNAWLIEACAALETRVEEARDALAAARESGRPTFIAYRERRLAEAEARLRGAEALLAAGE